MVQKTEKKNLGVHLGQEIGNGQKGGNRKSALIMSRQPSIRVLPSLCLSPLEVSFVEFYELKCEGLSDRESRKVAKGAHLLRELFGASSRVFFTGRLFTFPTREFPAVSHRVCGKKDERPTI